MEERRVRHSLYGGAELCCTLCCRSFFLSLPLSLCSLVSLLPFVHPCSPVHQPLPLVLSRRVFLLPSVAVHLSPHPSARAALAELLCNKVESSLSPVLTCARVASLFSSLLLSLFSLHEISSVHFLSNCLFFFFLFFFPSFPLSPFRASPLSFSPLSPSVLVHLRTAPYLSHRCFFCRCSSTQRPCMCTRSHTCIHTEKRAPFHSPFPCLCKV